MPLDYESLAAPLAEPLLQRPQAATLSLRLRVVFVIGTTALLGCWSASRWTQPNTVESLRAQARNNIKSLRARQVGWEAPESKKRCDMITKVQKERDAGKSLAELKEQYKTVAQDVNTFYRGTAYLFWDDFVRGGWGLYNLSKIGISATLADGLPIERTSTWTWVTGDQHLSNFGAWQNRHGNVVHGVNDFDEASIFDFRIDVWRIAVSIYNHAISNHLGAAQAEAAVLTFTDTYMATVESYVGNEKALLFEMTPQVATGKLGAFLTKTQSKNSKHKMLDKFTETGPDGARKFIKDDTTKLETVPADMVEKLRAAFGRAGYGATLQKVGWQIRPYSEAYFKVVDVAARVGSGVGSFGVGRYYVLLAGENRLLENGSGEAGGVILDVKYEPEPAVSAVLGPEDTDWYHGLFPSEAMRAVEAQRRLTSYTDPFTGWVVVDGKAFVVRQRSPFKESFDLASLGTFAEFAEYVQQIAVITATSHTRGTVGKSPGQFKEVVSAAFGSPYARATWGVSVVDVAESYRLQVLLDFECFEEYAKSIMEQEEGNEGGGEGEGE